MKIIVGLGNPGKKYERNRHNIGFKVLDAISEQLSFDSQVKFGYSLISKGNIGKEKVILVWPQTYMNLSGKAVLELVNFYKLDPKDLLIIYDEMDLQPGKIKLSKGGGAAGHNGLSSILDFITAAAFSRLRLGIGRPPKTSFNLTAADYVLSDFNSLEKDDIDYALKSAAEAAIYWVESGLEKSQLKFHTKNNK